MTVTKTMASIRWLRNNHYPPHRHFMMALMERIALTMTQSSKRQKEWRRRQSWTTTTTLLCSILFILLIASICNGQEKEQQMCGAASCTETVLNTTAYTNWGQYSTCGGHIKWLITSPDCGFQTEYDSCNQAASVKFPKECDLRTIF